MTIILIVVLLCAWDAHGTLSRFYATREHDDK